MLPPDIRKWQLILPNLSKFIRRWLIARYVSQKVTKTMVYKCIQALVWEYAGVSGVGLKTINPLKPASPILMS
jgi:hypothetical protein